MRQFLFVLLCNVCFLPGFSQLEGLRPNSVNLENIVYPFPVQYITLQCQGETLKMAYMQAAPDTPASKTVLLLHGKNFNGAYWESTARMLVENGFRVIMPDQIGFGKSSKPAHFQYTFQLLAQHTKALLDSLQIQKTAVLGHSMGGMLATRFALLYPESTEKLILENPIGLEDWQAVVPYQSVDENYKFELKQNYTAIKKYQQENYYGDEWRPEYDKWLNMLAGWTLSPDYSKIAWNAALTTDMIFTQPVVHDFDRLACPTLLIIGQRDRTALGKSRAPEAARDTLGNYPELGRRTAAKIKGSELVELEGIGHLPHIESFEQFIRPLLRFLEK